MALSRSLGRCSEPMCSPQVTDFLSSERLQSYGPGLAGALFGAGWWVWVDAVVQSSATLPFTQYLPGITATLALLMITAVRRDEMAAVDPFDEGVFCRSRFWLLTAYGVSGAAVVSAVLVMLHQYAAPESAGQYSGAAAILQVLCILGSALLFFSFRSPGDAASGGYSGF